jgi:hypothetical protein
MGDQSITPFSKEKNITNKINDKVEYLLSVSGSSLNYPGAFQKLDNFPFALNKNAVNYNVGSDSTKTYQKLYNEVEKLKNYKHFTPNSKIPDKKFINQPNLIVSKGNKENPFKYNNSLETVFNRTDSKLLQVVFRIITARNKTGEGTDQINLSAYMNGFKDNFNATWNEVNYNGRSDSFYIYNKGKRDVSFNLQIPCFNQKELFEKHRALGQLASVTAGTYNNEFLQGVLIKLNVGNYIVGEYAKLDSVSYSIPENATWDVDNGLSMYIEASFNFTIIHKDLPEYQPEFGFFKYLPNVLPRGTYLAKTREEDENGTTETSTQAAKRFAADYKT